MRSLGRLITFLGIVSLVAGGYGFAVMHTSYAPGLTGWVAEAYVHIGGLGFSLRHPEFLFRGFQALTSPTAWDWLWGDWAPPSWAGCCSSADGTRGPG